MWVMQLGPTLRVIGHVVRRNQQREIPVIPPSQQRVWILRSKNTLELVIWVWRINCDIEYDYDDISYRLLLLLVKLRDCRFVALMIEIRIIMADIAEHFIIIIIKVSPHSFHSILVMFLLMRQRFCLFLSFTFSILTN